MKKLLVTACLAVVSFAVSAQEIGARFGDHSAGNVAVDAVFSAGKFSRIHGDVSFGNGGVGIDALYDFIYRPLGGEAFDWYVGVGAYTFIGNNFALGVPGEIGLEYHFNEIPLAIGMDWRPALQIIDNTTFHSQGFGFNVRYVLGGGK